MPAIRLAIEQGGEEQGVRDIQWDSTRSAFLVLVGNSTSGPMGSNAPFKLYLWDGSDSGTVTLVKNVFFAKKMKPEGITHGTVGGKEAIIIADDAGGFSVLFDSDPRLEA
jgi:hypothetical protein